MSGFVSNSLLQGAVHQYKVKGSYLHRARNDTDYFFGSTHVTGCLGGFGLNGVRCQDSLQTIFSSTQLTLPKLRYGFPGTPNVLPSSRYAPRLVEELAVQLLPSTLLELSARPA